MASNAPAPTTLAPMLVDRLQTAKLLGICPNTVTNLEKRGELIPVRIGTRVLYDVNDIKRFIERQKGAAE